MTIKTDVTELKRLQQSARAMQGTHQVRLVDLFDNTFMRKNTRFSSLRAMVDEAGIEDFGEVSDADKDGMIRELAPKFSPGKPS